MEGTFPELADGRSIIWLDAVGVAWWATERAPLADFAPLVAGVGYGHRIGEARLAWRADFFTTPGDRRLAFIYADLLSVENVLDQGTVRPWWRVALGVGLDLVGEHVGLGTTGYFNDRSGASAGIGLAHGWGVDWFVDDAFFLRFEVDGRLYGGAGRIGLFPAAHAGFGWEL